MMKERVSMHHERSVTPRVKEKGKEELEES
jgi:hypothetical protein